MVIFHGSKTLFEAGKNRWLPNMYLLNFHLEARMGTMEFLQQELQELKSKGLYRKLRILQSEQLPESVIDGKKVVNLSSNNYLGLATHPRLRKAAREAIEKWGVGAGAVRPIIGTMEIHDQLEKNG